MKLKGTMCLLFLTTTFVICNSARIFDEVDPQEPQVIIDNLPLPGGAAANPSATSQAGPEEEEADDADPPVPQVEAEAPAFSDETSVPVVKEEPSLSFFMHDIFGGSDSHPSARVVIDDKLTEGQELDSGVVGRAQGFYAASSLDGSSQSILVTVLLHGHDGGVVEDSISLFGVHRTASPKSEVAVIGGTGKYENARGYAALETLLKEDCHTTDGVDTILRFNLYFTQ